jgi:type IV pilus assembly protein PilB
MDTLVANPQRKIGVILISLGFVSEEDLAKALELQKQNPGKKLGRILVEMGCITDQQVFQAIELQWEDWLKGSGA